MEIVVAAASAAAAAPSPARAIRKHPTHQTPAVVDVIQSLLGVQNARQTWIAVKKRLPAIKEHVTQHAERGGTVEYIDQAGFALLVSDLKSNTAQGQEALRALRTSALDIANRFWAADPTLATDLIDRIDDEAALDHIAQRLETKITQRKLTDAIKAAKGSGYVYGVINDANNVAVTGLNAKEIVAQRSAGKKRPTRDLFDTEELIEMQFLELQVQRALKHPDVEGNDTILKVQKAVLHKFKQFKQFKQ